MTLKKVKNFRKKSSMQKLRFLMTLFAAWLLATATNQVCALEIVVPAYFSPSSENPDDGEHSTDWERLNAAAKVIPLTVIVNPRNGPGKTQSRSFSNAVNSLRASGGRVIGYVSSSYTDREIPKIKKDIDKYAAWYNLDGIFIDEMTNEDVESFLNYYGDIYRYVKGIDPSWEVIGNPGINASESYLTKPAADRLMNFESYGNKYSAHNPSRWNANYDSKNFVNLLHGLKSQDISTMERYVDLAISRNVGGIYFTDDVLKNPWNQLPSFWDEQIAKVIGVNKSIATQTENSKQGLNIKNDQALLQRVGTPN